jgi:glutamate dehydrogenase (NADP+)
MMNGPHHGSGAADPRSGLSFLDPLRRQYGHQPVFLQAVEEMAQSLLEDGIFDDPNDGDFCRRAFLAMAEPERVISFRVSWTDDQGHLRFNRGWRVEFNRYEAPLAQILRLIPAPPVRSIPLSLH